MCHFNLTQAIGLTPSFAYTMLIFRHLCSARKASIHNTLTGPIDFPINIYFGHKQDPWYHKTLNLLAEVIYRLIDFLTTLRYLHLNFQGSKQCDSRNVTIGIYRRVNGHMWEQNVLTFIRRRWESGRIFKDAESRGEQMRSASGRMQAAFQGSFCASRARITMNELAADEAETQEPHREGRKEEPGRWRGLQPGRQRGGTLLQENTSWSLWRTPLERSKCYWREWNVFWVRRYHQWTILQDFQQAAAATEHYPWSS